MPRQREFENVGGVTVAERLPEQAKVPDVKPPEATKPRTFSVAMDFPTVVVAGVPILKEFEVEAETPEKAFDILQMWFRRGLRIVERN